ncbi:uncharacterized protein LOC110044598 [Orbicella faveolata]|uniref:uncharacterized protein LOC110044598 n=1 Tax=Orbicella faveolata TaxID=48498 RepID=UPI0009E49D24|nr:uncharacterized protein LOC110044598 [Orbicella faveolata]XP_020605816.1 uncharacterized protein LOC110044598 [Orbicella faveolata]XP_020605817.1 uncharacterized protein LOC110044598 [Orbicella faveolata]
MLKNMSEQTGSVDTEKDGSKTTAENEKNAVYEAVKSLGQLPWEFLNGSSLPVKELAQRIFAHPIISDFLIRLSRLDVFSKELASSFSSDLESLLLIRKLKYFYNQPTVAVLQQLASLVPRTDADAEAISKWNEIVELFAADSTTGTMPVRRLLQERGCPECYLENEEHLLMVDPHAVYPTSIYRRCEGDIVAKPDASLVECTMRYTLTTTAKIVYEVLNPTNPELKNVYRPLGRCVAVIDNKVENTYGEAIQTYFDANSVKLQKVVIPASEVDKDITTVQNVLVQLRKLRLKRNEPVLVVGGGVIHDVIGCATSLYHRNTPYIMLSTSVVAGIDAGLSPRTGCDGFGFKNLFGSYHPPVLTLTDRSFFHTLHRGCLRHGIAEIVKIAVVKDEDLFCLLEQEATNLLSTKFGIEMQDFQGDKKAFENVCDLIIGKALEYYMRSEYSNIWETHQCRPHAYGHTWSAGYELASGMLHGHAVATGMGFGAYLSFCNSWITQHELNRILKLLSDLELSLWHPIMKETETLYRVQESVIEKRAGNLVAPVPKGLGKCGYINDMPYKLLDKRLGEYREICQRYPRQGVGIEVHCKDIGLDDPATVGNVNKDLPKDDVQDGALKNCLQYNEKMEE